MSAVPVPGESVVRLQPTWRQAMTPSAGFGAMLFIGALLGTLADLRHGDGLAVAAAAVVALATVLWRRLRWLVQLGPDGLLVRRIRTVRRTRAQLRTARLVGKVSQLRLQVDTSAGTLLLPAPRGMGLVGDALCRSQLEDVAAYWSCLGQRFDTTGLAGPDGPVLVLRRSVLTVWPWAVLGLASLVWQLVEPTMGGDLTVVALTLIVWLQVHQPRPVLRAGLWVSDGERFVAWSEVLRLRVVSRYGSRRVLVLGDDFREELTAPVDLWWARNARFDATVAELEALWHPTSATPAIPGARGRVRTL